MAEDKKKEKPKPAGWNLDSIEFILLILFLLAILSTLGPTFFNYLNSGEISFYGYKLSNIGIFFKNNLLVFKILGFAIAGIAALATFVLIKKGDAVWREEKAKMYPADLPKVSNQEIAPKVLQSKWQKIIGLSESLRESDWRLAVIEADIMLDDLLSQLQLPGETMGDKLKAVEPSDFRTIDLAWEAHKARNAIAHQGSDFLLNQREARRIISLYETVFKEFHLI